MTVQLSYARSEEPTPILKASSVTGSSPLVRFGRREGHAITAKLSPGTTVILRQGLTPEKWMGTDLENLLPREQSHLLSVVLHDNPGYISKVTKFPLASNKSEIQ